MGRGSGELYGVEHITHAGATLSKAFCSHGAIVGCSAATALHLRDLPQIRGSSAGSSVSAAVGAASLKYVANHPHLREELTDTTRYFRTLLTGLGVQVPESPAPIVTFKYGGRNDMEALQRRLWREGIHIYHSSYGGAGPYGVIRAVFRDHSRADIDRLVSAIKST